jgi:O-antigen ligase
MTAAPTMPVAKRWAEKVTLLNRYFFCGALASFVFHALSELWPGLAGLKPDEYLLLGFIVAAYAPEPASRMVGARRSLLALTFGLTLWALFADSAPHAEHQSLLLEYAKTSQVFVMLVAPVALFLTTRHQGPVLKFALGLYLGQSIYSATVIVLQLAGLDLGYTLDHGEHSLKWLLPIPISFLIVLLLCYRFLSAGQRVLWVCLLLVVAIAETIAEQRTDVAIVLTFVWLFSISRLVVGLQPRLTVPVVTAWLLIVGALPVALAASVPIERVIQSADSPSNVLRVFLLQTGLSIIPDHALFGIGGDPQNFTDIYLPWYRQSVSTYVPDEVTSTHNFFLDLAVEFGVPALALWGCIFVLLSRLALRQTGPHWLTILTLSAIIVTYAVLPLSGDNRLGTGLMWMCMLRSRRPEDGL